MELIVGKFPGFCSGVENAVKKAKEALIENKENIYCLGDIVHNNQVIEFLKSKGMIFVDNIEDAPNKSKVIFRVHGEASQIYKRAIEKELSIIDLTCPNIELVHKKLEREFNRSFIIIIGKKDHPEIVADIGYCGENYCIVNDNIDIINAYNQIKKTDLKRVFVVCQTTYSSKKYTEFVEFIRKQFIDYDVVIEDTICNIILKRQLETREISKNVDKMFIVGCKNSFNTSELLDIAKSNCKEVYFIETIKDLKGKKFKVTDKVGIIAGNSTPKETIDEIVLKLKSLRFNKITKNKKEIFNEMQEKEDKLNIAKNINIDNDNNNNNNNNEED